jgi:hypothetical protein
MTGKVEIRGHSGRDFVDVPFDDGRLQIIRRFEDPCMMSQETIESPRKSVKWNTDLDVWSHEARQGRGIKAARVEPVLVAVREFKEFFTGHRLGVERKSEMGIRRAGAEDGRLRSIIWTSAENGPLVDQVVLRNRTCTLPGT